MSAFSFCQDKILTTAGEGGALVTDDESLWKQAWSFKDHGKVWDRVYSSDHPPGFRWLHGNLGTNWRLSEVQSAVGRVQLRKLDEWVAHRRALAGTYAERLREVKGLRVPTAGEGVEPACYRLYAYVEPQALKAGWSRDRLLAEGAASGLALASGSCSEIYLEDAFPEAMKPKGGCPVARELGETSLAFLVDPTVTRQDVERTCEGVAKLMAEAAR